MKLGSRAKPAIPPVEPGTYFAVCIGAVDLGEQETTYQKRIFPTGYNAIKNRPELIMINAKYKMSTEDMGWVCWNLYLSPNWQYCTHGSYQWMYSICDGQELYNTIIGMLPE